ncbi:MAG: hypothetical protein LT080_03220 [Thiobacillus sp.]|nr:hypothetical protein [Thiobacillus sp.]
MGADFSLYQLAGAVCGNEVQTLGTTLVVLGALPLWAQPPPAAKYASCGELRRATAPDVLGHWIVAVIAIPFLFFVNSCLTYPPQERWFISS